MTVMELGFLLQDFKVYLLICLDIVLQRFLLITRTISVHIF